MPRRRRLPPDVDPKRVYGASLRGPKHVCDHCKGTTRPVKGQKLDEAIAIHEASCPAILRVQPKRKGTQQP